jgi:hypothetical protein
LGAKLATGAVYVWPSRHRWKSIDVVREAERLRSGLVEHVAVAARLRRRIAPREPFRMVQRAPDIADARHATLIGCCELAVCDRLVAGQIGQRRSDRRHGPRVVSPLRVVRRAARGAIRTAQAAAKCASGDAHPCWRLGQVGRRGDVQRLSGAAVPTVRGVDYKACSSAAAISAFCPRP